MVKFQFKGWQSQDLIFKLVTRGRRKADDQFEGYYAGECIRPKECGFSMSFVFGKTCSLHIII
jgi:hypothetical protein